ncbi:MAG: hypothetical protein AAGA56_23465 [Myxococcota bacterium]
MKVVLVGQRYGPRVKAEAEQSLGPALLRALAEGLVGRASEVRMLATTADETSRTFENHYPEVWSHLDGVVVERYDRVLPRLPLAWLLPRARWRHLARGPYVPRLLRRLKELAARDDDYVFVLVEEDSALAELAFDRVREAKTCWVGERPPGAVDAHLSRDRAWAELADALPGLFK